jgi:hypothetical protein
MGIGVDLMTTPPACALMSHGLQELIMENGIANMIMVYERTGRFECLHCISCQQWNSREDAAEMCSPVQGCPQQGHYVFQLHLFTKSNMVVGTDRLY